MSAATTSYTDVFSSSLPRGAGPLTTVFTTPDFCAMSAWTNFDTLPLSSSICLPNGFTTYWIYKYGFYSPGICPQSYTAGCSWPTAAATVSNGTPFLGGPLETGESAIICCPIGYTCMNDSTDEYNFSKCKATTETVVTMPALTQPFVTTTPLAFAVQVRWKESDMNALETNPTRSGLTITPTPTSTTAGQTTAAATTGGAASTSSASSTGTSQTSSNGSSFSTGAAIGVGVGVAVAAVVLAIITYLFWRRAKSRKNAAALALGDGSDAGGGRKSGKKFTELQDTQVSRGSAHVPAELHSPEGDTFQPSTWGGSTLSPLSPRPNTATTGGATEMEAPDARHELPGHVTDFAEMPASNQYVAELPGDMPGKPREKWQM
ncbi:hypothetical protein MPH_00215 [Macrophomina phaseolina MS6]|uniref:Uncharacterized protein n=1 Tax=Macrophomina phaseolina (strain MS6) TaxID=1126212 RepID=K2T0R0_MACPH|nr:hypothetical protein MPH_00215 [Macrophomina phaseolina MS6]